jgi:hypothetical protein
MPADNTWKRLQIDRSHFADLNLGQNYTVLDPRNLYLGRSYSDYAADWFNWFLSSNADNRNSGPVVFLRSKSIPDRETQSYDLEVSEKTTTAASSYDAPNLYVNEPNIRVGIDKLEIFSDQAVFVPIIVAYDYSNLSYKDWAYLQEYCGITIDNGDNPPDLIQLTINNNTIELPGEEKKNFSDFRIATPIFTAVVPEAPYGTSLKDFLESPPLSPGSYPAMITGYFVMLKFEPGNYWIHSWASAGREVRGPYFSELLYQIDVITRPTSVPHHIITVRRPARFLRIADRAVKKMTDDKQLTPSESGFFKEIQEQSNTLLKEKIKTLQLQQQEQQTSKHNQGNNKK